MRIQGAFLCGAAAVWMTVSSPMAGYAATCSVEAASQAALQRRLAVIDAAKVNPSEFFTGANSCISPDLLKSFDLSAVIPDLAGFLTNGLQNVAQQAINAAKQQVCKVLNEQINEVISKINDATSSFSSGLSGELSGILGSSFSISAPSSSSYGSYDLSSLASDFDFDGLSSAVSEVGTSLTTTSSEASSVTSTLSDTSSSSTGTSSGSSSSSGASWLAQ